LSLKHYHVLNGLLNCTPDNNDVYMTKQEAKEGLSWMVSQLRENEPYFGSLKDQFYISKSQVYYVEISDPCYESECTDMENLK
tara:strand:- start:628 stop:876 length:249 start_codon:yes stop_codon:yes gene_type:complete